MNYSLLWHFISTRVTCATRNYDTGGNQSFFPPPPRLFSHWGAEDKSGREKGSSDRGKPMIEVDRELVRARKTINHAVTACPCECAHMHELHPRLNVRVCARI